MKSLLIDLCITTIIALLAIKFVGIIVILVATVFYLSWRFVRFSRKVHGRYGNRVVAQLRRVA